MGLLPLLAQHAREQTHLKWISAPPPWVSFLYVLGAVLFVAVLYAREYSPAAGRGPRLFLAFLRTLALVGIWVLLGELVETTTREEVRPSWVVVMIDESVSMTLKDRYSQRSRVEGLAGATGIPDERIEEMTRLELVKAALAKDDWALVKALSEQNKLKMYAFSKRPMPLLEADTGALAKRLSAEEQLEELRKQGAKPPAEGTAPPKGGPEVLQKLADLQATGPETALGDSLNKVINETRGQHVAGIVLVTDGRSNSGDVIPQKAARRAKSRGVPIFTIGVGNPEEPKDVALMDLVVPEVVIAGDILPVKVAVKAQGFEGDDGRAEIIVKLDDELLKAEPIQLQGGGARQDVAVRVKPEKPGEYTLSVEVPPRPGELIADNNRLTQRLRVIDKKIKVLYVEQLPRYEFRYLRSGLIRDKNMEAHTFLLSADPEFVQDTSPGLTPLTAVPSTREELFQYHVIVLGDVDPHDPQMGEERLKLIREFVEDHGGGLLVIAGQYQMPRAYAGTPLEPLLPVTIETADDELTGSTRPLTDEYRPKLTLDGRRHPVLQLENDPDQNLELWQGQALPGLYWFYRPREKKRTAEVLATHPTELTSKGEPVPILAVQAAGAGTTFYAGADEVWRWRAGVGDRYAYRLWGQAVRYLSTGRLVKSKRFSVTTDKANYDLGERVLISAEVNDRTMKPATDETQAIVIEGPDGTAERLELTRLPQAPGRYEGSRVPPKVGTYRVSFAAGANAEKPDAGEELAPPRVFQVQVPVLEKADPKMDEELLKKLASSTGGQYLALADIARLPQAIGVGAVREVSEVRTAERVLWDRWWVLCAVTGVLCLEWIARKYWKML